MPRRRIPPVLSRICGSGPVRVRAAGPPRRLSRLSRQRLAVTSAQTTTSAVAHENHRLIAGLVTDLPAILPKQGGVNSPQSALLLRSRRAGSAHRDQQLHPYDRAPVPPERKRLAGAEGALSSKVTVDGKQFAVGGSRFNFRGVTYGTFAPRADGHQFPERDRIKRDFASMCEAGFTVVRTYTAPPDDLVELAGDWGLRVLAGVFYPDWRYSVGASIRQARGV